MSAARQECRNTDVGLSLDYTCMNVAPEFFERMAPRIARALADMKLLESGAIANRDERRMVGHYWLRTPELAPDATIRAEIEHARQAVVRFVADVHAGMIKPPGADRFSRVLIIGIGGSALGPQFVADALGHPHHDRLKPCFFDNTDPDGMARVIAELGEKLAETLCVVISKSGGTPETRNGMLFAERAYAAAGLSFAAHAVAITSADSHLDRHAVARQWRARFPMWDWVGGRTSVTSAVGLLPAALQGLDVDELLRGAAACDAATRGGDARSNPALLMALLWHWAADGRGARDMVMLPYKDRLLLLSRYLQQLIMESIGKRHDLAGREVDQGLTVYGNKGSTDQHAYVQQLRDGLDNFFVTFIRVLQAGESDFEVEPGVTAGDYLHGFLLGTRSALAERGRRSMTLSVPRVDPFHVGVLIALFERAVGFYASLIGINAYHQPGVEAGKKAAAVVLDVQKKLSEALSTTPRPAAELAKQIAAEDGVVLDLLEHLAANGRAARTSANGEDRFSRNPE